MATTERATRPPRVILAKPGLDGHDRGIKVVGMALRDAGAEVIYLGLHVDAEHAAAAAAAEDADVIGLSVLSGVHLSVTEDLLRACRAAGLDDVAVVVGGTIPPQDVVKLLGMGARGVFPVGTSLAEVTSRVFGLADEMRGAP